jgi:hypothetical protein
MWAADQRRTADRTAKGREGGQKMVDWAKIFETTGTVLRGVNDAAIVNNWLQMDDQGAFTSIAAQVRSSSTSDIDRLDAALLTLAATNFNAETRQRLIKFYVVFKLVEVDRFGEFRGFP